MNRSRRESHLEAVQDTGHCYSEFYGWTLTCCWCDHQANGRTKADALAALQKHYDAICGDGRVVVLARTVER